MNRLDERYGIKWTATIESDLDAQWKAMKGRDPKPHQYGCVWYTFTLAGKDVRLLIGMNDKIVITCGLPQWVDDPFSPSTKRKPKRRRTSGAPHLDNRRPKPKWVR